MDSLEELSKLQPPSVPRRESWRNIWVFVTGATLSPITENKLMTIYRNVNCIFVFSAIVLSVTAAAHAASYTVTDLGVSGAENSLGWGINAGGQVTGYAGTPDEETVTGFVWNPTTANGPTGTLHRLDTLGGYFSWGIGINAGGQVSGLAATADEEAEHATLWNPTTPNSSSGTLYDLGTLGGTYSQGAGINDSGQLTGYSDLINDEESHAIMWKPTNPGSASGTMHDLGTLGGSLSFGWDINVNGQVTGYSDTTDNDTTHAFLWKPSTPNGTTGTMHDLGSLGGTRSEGSSINDSGQVAGSSLIDGDEVYHAFVWTPTIPGGTSGTMLDLESLNGPDGDSYGYSVGNAGLVVGATEVDVEVSYNTHAFLYTSGSGMVDLNTLIDPLSGWELLDASEINEAGQITGQGLINGEYHAYLLTPVQIHGDYNGNGIVDAADYAIWRNNVGGTTLVNRGPSVAGPVGPADYVVWKAQFGATSTSGSAGALPFHAAAPEPSSLALFTVVMLGLPACRWRRRRQ